MQKKKMKLLLLAMESEMENLGWLLSKGEFGDFFLDELVSDFKCQCNYTPVKNNDSIFSNWSPVNSKHS